MWSVWKKEPRSHHKLMQRYVQIMGKNILHMPEYVRFGEKREIITVKHIKSTSFSRARKFVKGYMKENRYAEITKTNTQENHQK